VHRAQRVHQLPEVVRGQRLGQLAAAAVDEVEHVRALDHLPLRAAAAARVSSQRASMRAGRAARARRSLQQAVGAPGGASGGRRLPGEAQQAAWQAPRRC